MKIKFSNKSKKNLSVGLDYRLVHIIMEAQKLDYIHDWGLFETKRTLEQQKKYVANGTSRTLNSKHIPDNLGIVRAFDVVPWIDGKWMWDGIKAKECFDEIISNLKKLAIHYYPEQITFGEDWKSLVDRPHVEITTGKEIR